MQEIKAEDTNGLLSSLIQNALNGEQIVITMANKPVVKIEACSDETQSVGEPILGSAKGKITYIADDFDAPLDDFKDYM